MQSKGQFAQFFEDVEETVTPTKGSRFAPQTPNTRLSVSDLEKTTSAMTPRMEIMLRKEQKAREEAAQLTFRPHVNKNGNGNSHSATKSTSKDQSNRFDALYSDALKRHLETKWKETADEKDLTFQPKINPRGRASSRQSSRAGSRASSQEREAAPTGERLHATPKGKLKHGVDPDNKLTFKPEITKRAMSIDRKESAKRLYVSNSLEKEKSKALMRETEIKERELENCTFSPKLIQPPPKFAPKAKIDLNERMSKFEEMKRAKIQEAQRLREEKEIADATFKPVLKAKLKRAPTPTKPFHERLAQPMERQVPVEITKEIEATMTFKPTLISKRASSPNGRASEYNSVHERLFKEGEARKRETQMAMEALKHEAETSFTFSPEINHHSKAATGELGPVFERLATSTSKQYMQEVLMKVKTELELKECTFHPKLSTEGHRYVPKDKETDSLPVHERLNQEAEAKRLEKERLEAVRVEEAVRRHSFAPQIPEASKSMISMRSFTSPDAGGSVSGDDIFSRLNAQTTIAKSPMVRDAAIAKESPQRTRSSVTLTEAEHSSLYDRLSSTPRSLSFIEKNRGSVDPNDDRASSVNRRSQAEIDSVINRLHSSQTKAMKAPAFEDPTSFHTILRSNSMSRDTTPNATPDKVSMRKSFSGDAPPPMTFGGSSPLRRSASISMASPMSRSNSMMGMSPSAAAPSPMSRHSSIRMSNNNTSSASGVATSSSSAGEGEDTTPVKASPAPASRGSFVQHPRPVSEELPPAPVVAAVAPPAAPVVAPKPKPVAAPASTAAPAATTKPSAFKSNGDDFMAKIEASMNMLQMNPADIVAQQQNKGIAATAPSPVPEPVAAPAPVQVAPVAAAPAVTEETVEEVDDEEVEVVDSVDNL